jgi:transposase-like protein
MSNNLTLCYYCRNTFTIVQVTSRYDADEKDTVICCQECKADMDDIDQQLANLEESVSAVLERTRQWLREEMMA